MPSGTLFGSIAVSKQYLQKIFGQIDHLVITSLLQATENLVLESGVSAEIINTASAMLISPVSEDLGNHYYKLKCE